MPIEGNGPMGWRLVRPPFYVLGGISPFGQSRRHRTFVEKIALSMESIYVSAGKRGQEIRIVPNAFSALLDASFVTLTNYD